MKSYIILLSWRFYLLSSKLCTLAFCLSQDGHSVVIGSLVVIALFYVGLLCHVFVCDVVLNVISSFAIMSRTKRQLVALL